MIITCVTIQLAATAAATAAAAVLLPPQHHPANMFPVSLAYLFVHASLKLAHWQVAGGRQPMQLQRRPAQ